MALENQAHKHCSYSPEPRAEVYWAICHALLTFWDEWSLSGKQARDSFRNILRIISSKVVYSTVKWDIWQKIHGKIRNEGVAQNNVLCSSQIKEEFTCLCCCGCHQDYTTSSRYKMTRLHCKVTNLLEWQLECKSSFSAENLLEISKLIHRNCPSKAELFRNPLQTGGI